MQIVLRRNLAGTSYYTGPSDQYDPNAWDQDISKATPFTAESGKRFYDGHGLGTQIERVPLDETPL